MGIFSSGIGCLVAPDATQGVGGKCIKEVPRTDIYIYICRYICIYIHIYPYIHTYIFIYTYMSPFMESTTYTSHIYIYNIYIYTEKGMS